MENQSNDTYAEVGKIITNGVVTYSVRVIEKGSLTVKAHCNSLDEAREIARLAGDRLGKLDIREIGIE